MEKFCPVCGRVYEADATTCEDDGERLVILTEDPSLVGRELEGKYTLTDELGQGGMGTVYLAHQSTMDREVAVKVLKRQFSQNKLAIKRFLREARAASKLAHPNTITVYDFGQTADGLLYMVMEKLNGRPLSDILDEEGAIGWQRAVHILTQVCDSLAEAHANGITHRDLKPENIFIEPKFGNPEHVKVLDFGIAKMTDDSNTQATATGMICGTPSYMSPEQAMGKAIDGRSDVYALGILLFECLTCERPFDGETAMEVMLKHLNEDVPKLPPDVEADTPPGLVALIERMLAKKADDRPEDCVVLKRLFMEAAGTSSMSGMESLAMGAKKAPSEGSGTRKRPQTRDAVTNFDSAGLIPSDSEDGVPGAGRRKLWLAAAVLLLVGGGVAAFLATRGGDERRPTLNAAEASTGELATRNDGAAAGGAAEVPKDAPADEPSEPKRAVASPLAEPKPASEEHDAGRVAGRALDATGERGIRMVAEPEAEMVSLTVKSDPDGANVYEGDKLLGQTPLTFQRVKDSGTVTLTLKQKGYKDEQLLLGTAMSLTQTRSLDSIAKASKRRSSGSKKRRKKKTGGAASIGTF